MDSDIHASTKRNKYEAYRITNLGSMTSSLKNGSFMFMEVLSSFYLRFKEKLLKKELITKIMLQIQHTKCYNNKFTNKRLSYSADNKLEVLEKIFGQGKSLSAICIRVNNVHFADQWIHMFCHHKKITLYTMNVTISISHGYIFWEMYKWQKIQKQSIILDDNLLHLGICYAMQQILLSLPNNNNLLTYQNNPSTWKKWFTVNLDYYQWWYIILLWF